MTICENYPEHGSLISNCPMCGAPVCCPKCCDGMRLDLESKLKIGVSIKLGSGFLDAHSNFLPPDSIITLVRGSFDHDNGLYCETQYAPSIWNEDQKEFDSIYHLFENDLSGFRDCEILEPKQKEIE